MAAERTTDSGIVLSADRAASAAGVAALNEGGNAVDAAVAATLALCVCRPASVGIGGYGGSLAVHLAKDARTACIDFDSRAPLAYRRELFADPKAAQTGYLAATVPGVPAGLGLALRRFGRLRFSAVARHAVALAEEGFAVDDRLARWMADHARLADDASLRAMFPDGRTPAKGDLYVQKDLGRLLRDLGDDPDAIYRGDLARRIVKHVRDHGGILSEEDFARVAATETEPLRVRYLRHELVTPQPPSGGVTSLAIVQTLEQLRAETLDPWGAPYMDLVVEAIRHCWAERERSLGDPDFVNVPLGEMLSDAAALARADRIRRGDRARPATTLPAHGDDTVNVVAVDRDRNVVSLTATHGGAFGSRVTVPALGLTLGHGMSRFDFAPGHPNAPAPGKRMHHNMSPVVILKDGHPAGAVGMPGGRAIVTVTAQLLVGLLGFRAGPGKVVAAPRVHNEGDASVRVSRAAPDEVAAELKLMGHTVERIEEAGGWANAAVIAPDGRITGAAQVDEGLAAQ